MSQDQRDRVIQQVRAAPKYADICPDLVAQVAEVELGKRTTVKEAVKASKRKLHQIGGAYFRERMRYDAWRAELIDASGDDVALRQICRRILRAHASTNERLPELASFYHTLLSGLPPIHSVLDLACGLNPLAIPWLGLAEGCRYTGIDIYRDMMAFLADVTPALGVEPDMRAADISRCALPAADVALVLKTLPVLDQLDATASARLLERIQAPVIVVTFPNKSLGNRNKGMPQNYARRFEELTAAKPWGIESFMCESELAFRIRKG